MAKLEETMRAEISRLSKKEIKKVFFPLTKDLRQLKRTVSQLSKSISVLEKTVALSAKESGVGKKAEEEKPVRIRFSPASVKRIRKRLGVTQRNFARLLGVSLPSIAGWERGRTRPQGRNLMALFNLRKMGTREMHKILAEKKVKPTPEKSAKRSKSVKPKQKKTSK